MTSAPATALPVTPNRRSEILLYAAALIHPDERQPDTVIAAAEPLLAWAAAATDNDDQRNRMRAMAHVNGNAPQYRTGYMTGAEIPSRPTPDRFLADARAYYQFITEA